LEAKGEREWVSHNLERVESQSKCVILEQQLEMKVRSIYRVASEVLYNPSELSVYLDLTVGEELGPTRTFG